MADLCASRHHMKRMIQELLDETGIPFATMNSEKGIINESYPSFLGMYNGDFSSEGVKERVENSDCILSFGSVWSDFNTGGFTCKIDAFANIEIHSSHVKIHHAFYPNVCFNEVIPELTNALKGYKHQEKITNSKRPNDKPSKGSRYLVIDFSHPWLKSTRQRAKLKVPDRPASGTLR